MNLAQKYGLDESSPLYAEAIALSAEFARIERAHDALRQEIDAFEKAHPQDRGLDADATARLYALNDRRVELEARFDAYLKRRRALEDAVASPTLP